MQLFMALLILLIQMSWLLWAEEVNSEMQNRKWLWGGIALQLGTGYTVAFLVYQIGTFLTTDKVGAGFAPGLAAVAAMALIVVFLIRRTRKQFKLEYGLNP